MRKLIEPYEHDCAACKYMGWLEVKEGLANVYLHEGEHPTIVIRLSSEPCDYIALQTGVVKGNLGVDEELYRKHLENQEKRRKHYGSKD